MIVNDSGYNIEVLRGDGIFESLRCDWHSLWLQCPDATEAQTWHWQRLYREHIASSQSLFTVVARDPAGALAALGLFSVRLDRNTLLKQLSFFGEHDVDYHAILHRADAPPELGRRMFGELIKQAGKAFSTIELSNVPAGSWTAKALEYSVNDRNWLGAMVSFKQSDTYAIRLPSSVDDYWTKFDKKKAAKLRSEVRKLGRDFKADFRVHNSAGTNLAVLDEVEAVDRNRWGSGSRFAEVSTRSFLRSVIPALQEDGICRIFTLHLNQQCTAYVVGFVSRGCIRIQYTAHDASLPGNYSVGKICNIWAIEDSIRSGLHTYDLTRGSEPYKALLGGEVRHNLHATSFRSHATYLTARINARFLSPVVRPVFRGYKRFKRFAGS